MDLFILLILPQTLTHIQICGPIEDLGSNVLVLEPKMKDFLLDVGLNILENRKIVLNDVRINRSWKEVSVLTRRYFRRFSCMQIENASSVKKDFFCLPHAT